MDQRPDLGALPQKSQKADEWHGQTSLIIKYTFKYLNTIIWVKPVKASPKSSRPATETSNLEPEKRSLTMAGHPSNAVAKATPRAFGQKRGRASRRSDMKDRLLERLGPPCVAIIWRTFTKATASGTI